MRQQKAGDFFWALVDAWALVVGVEADARSGWTAFLWFTCRHGILSMQIWKAGDMAAPYNNIH